MGRLPKADPAKYILILRNTNPAFPDQLCRDPDAQDFEMNLHQVLNVKDVLIRKYPSNVYEVYKLELVK